MNPAHGLEGLRAVVALVVVSALLAAECDVPVSTDSTSSPKLTWEVRDHQTGERHPYHTDDATHFAAAGARLNVTLRVEDAGGIRLINFYGGQRGRCKDSLRDVDETYPDQRLDFTGEAADGTAPSRWVAGFQHISGVCPTGGVAWVNAELVGYASNFSGLDDRSTLQIRIPLPPVPFD